jgi:hypothetical protein
MIAITQKRMGIKVRLFALFITLSSALVLPQVCHLLGDAAGVGSTLGEMLLPMHLPILLAGYLAGPFVGGVAGAVAPLLSFALTGMPKVALLPFMVIELCVYGVVAGVLAKSKLPVLLQVIIAQVAGRAIRALVIAVAIYGFSYTAIPVSIIWNSIRIGLIGVLLQCLLIPLVVYRVKHASR